MQYYDQAVKFRNIVLGMSRKYHAHLMQFNNQLVKERAVADEATKMREEAEVALLVARQEIRRLKARDE